MEYWSTVATWVKVIPGLGKVPLHDLNYLVIYDNYHTGRRTLAFFSLTAKAITANGQKTTAIGQNTNDLYSMVFNFESPWRPSCIPQGFFFGQKHVPDFVVHVFAIF